MPRSRTSSLDSCGVRDSRSTHRVRHTRYRSDTDIRIKKEVGPHTSDQNKYVVFCCEKGGQRFQEVTSGSLTGHTHTGRNSSVERCRHRSPSPSEVDGSLSRCRSKSRFRDHSDTHRCCDKDKSTGHTFSTQSRRHRSKQRSSLNRRSPSRLRSKSRDSGAVIERWINKPDIITTEMVKPSEGTSNLNIDTEHSGISFDIDPMYRPIYLGTMYEGRNAQILNQNQNKGTRIEFKGEATEKKPDDMKRDIKDALVKSLYNQYLKDIKRLGKKAMNMEYLIRAPGLCGKFVHGSGKQGIIITDPKIVQKEAGHGTSTRKSSPRRSKRRNKSLELASMSQHDMESRTSSPERNKYQSILKTSSHKTRPKTERSVSRGKSCDSDVSTVKRSSRPGSRRSSRHPSRESSSQRQGKQSSQSYIRSDKSISRSQYEQESESSTRTALRTARCHTQSPNQQLTEIKRNVPTDSQCNKPKSRSTTPNSRSRQPTKTTDQSRNAVYMKHEHPPSNLQDNHRKLQYSQMASPMVGHTNVQYMDNKQPYYSEHFDSVRKENHLHVMQTNNEKLHQTQNSCNMKGCANSQQDSRSTSQYIANNEVKNYVRKLTDQEPVENIQPRVKLPPQTYINNQIQTNVPREHIATVMQYNDKNESQNSHLHKSFDNKQISEYLNTNIQSINENSPPHINVQRSDLQFYEARNSLFLNAHKKEGENIFKSQNPYRQQVYISQMQNPVERNEIISTSECNYGQPIQFASQTNNPKDQITLFPSPQRKINENTAVERGSNVNPKHEVTFSDQQFNTSVSGKQYERIFPEQFQVPSNSQNINSQGFQDGNDRKMIQEQLLPNTQCYITTPNQFVQINGLANKSGTYSESQNFLRNTDTPQFHVKNNSNNFQTLNVAQFTKANTTQTPTDKSSENVINNCSRFDRKLQVPQLSRYHKPLHQEHPPPKNMDNMTMFKHCEYAPSGSGYNRTATSFQRNKLADYTNEYSGAHCSERGLMENPAMEQGAPHTSLQSINLTLNNPVQHRFSLPNQAHVDTELANSIIAHNTDQYHQNISGTQSGDDKVNNYKSKKFPNPNYNTNVNYFPTNLSCVDGHIQPENINNGIRYQPKLEAQDSTSKLLHYPGELQSHMCMHESCSINTYSRPMFQGYSMSEAQSASNYPNKTNNVMQQSHLPSHLHNGNSKFVLSKEDVTMQQRQQVYSQQNINERPIQNPELNIPDEQEKHMHDHQLQKDSVTASNLYHQLQQSDTTGSSKHLQQSVQQHNNQNGHLKHDTMNTSNESDGNDFENIQNQIQRAFYEGDRLCSSLLQKTVYLENENLHKTVQHNQTPVFETDVTSKEDIWREMYGSTTQEASRSENVPFPVNVTEMQSFSIGPSNGTSQKQQTCCMNNELTHGCDMKNKCYFNAQDVPHTQFSHSNCRNYQHKLDEKSNYQNTAANGNISTNSQNMQKFSAANIHSGREDMFKNVNQVPIDLQSNQGDKSCDSDYEIGNLNPDLLYRALKRLIQEQELIASSEQKALKKRSENMDMKKSAILETVQNTSENLLSMLNELNYDEAINLLSELKTNHKASLGSNLKGEDNLNTVNPETSTETPSNSEVDDRTKPRKSELNMPKLENKAFEKTDEEVKQKDETTDSKTTLERASQDSNINTEKEPMDHQPVNKHSIQEFYIIGHIRSADYLEQHKALQSCQNHDVVIKIEPVGFKVNQGNASDASTNLDATNLVDMAKNHVGSKVPHDTPLHTPVQALSISESTQQNTQMFTYIRPDQSYPQREQALCVNPYPDVLQHDSALQIQRNKETNQNKYNFGCSKDYYTAGMKDPQERSTMFHASNLVNVTNSKYRVFEQNEHGNTLTVNNACNESNIPENSNNFQQLFHSSSPNQCQQENSKIQRCNKGRKRSQNTTVLKKSSHHYIVRKRLRERSVNNRIQEEPLVVNKQFNFAPPVQNQQIPSMAFQIMTNTNTLSQTHVSNSTIPKLNISSSNEVSHEANNSHNPQGKLFSQSHNSTTAPRRNPFNFNQIQSETSKTRPRSISKNRVQELDNQGKNQRNVSTRNKNNSIKKMQEPQINTTRRSTAGAKISVRSENSEKQKRLTADAHSMLRTPSPTLKTCRP